MQIHDRVVGSFVAIHHGIGVKTYNQVIAFGTRLLEEVEMPYVEQVESSGYVNDPISWLSKKIVTQTKIQVETFVLVPLALCLR